MNPASHLTGKKILEANILAIIPNYLLAGETAEQIIKQNGGDLVKTIQFLRERSYESLEIVKRKPKEKVKEPAPAKKPKGNPKSSGQEKLF